MQYPRTKTRNAIGLTTCISVLSLALAGCSGGKGSEARDVDFENVDYSGTISIITRYADSENNDFIPMLAEAFQEQHPDVTFDIVQESDQGYKDKVKVLTSSNSLPDIYFTWPGEYTQQFVDAGLALDLSSQVAPGTQWGDTIVPSALASGKYNDAYYGIPVQINAKFMLYNKAIFEENGIEIPKDFGDFLTACDTLKDAGVEPLSFGNQYGWPGLHYLTQLNAYNVPAETLAADYAAQGDGKFDDPGYEQSLEQFTEILDHCMTNGEEANGILHNDAKADWNSGKTAMAYLEWFEFVDNGMPADEWDFFVLPPVADAAGTPSMLLGAPDLFMVNPKGDNPALATEFLKFVASKEGADVILEVMPSLPSPVIGVVNEENSSEHDAKALALINDSSEFAVWIDTLAYPPVATAYLSGGEALVSKSQTPEEVMKAIQEAATGR